MGVIIHDAYTSITTPVEDTPSIIAVGRVCTDGSSSSGIQDDNSIDKTLYRVFSMQDDMKVLQYPDRVRNEFELFLEYAEKKTAGTEYDSRFDQLDTYLGTVGVTNVIC